MGQNYELGYEVKVMKLGYEVKIMFHEDILYSSYRKYIQT